MCRAFLVQVSLRPGDRARMPKHEQTKVSREEVIRQRLISLQFPRYSGVVNP